MRLYINVVCVLIEPHGPWLKSDVPTVIGLGVGMSLFMALTCLVLKLFSRARFAQARGYGNAHLPPPATATSASHSGKVPVPRYLLQHLALNISAIFYMFMCISDGKHRQSYHRQMSVTESEAATGEY